MAHEKEYHFNFEDKSSNDLYQSVYQDSQNIYGIQIYYIPLDQYEEDEIDGIWGEIDQKNYSSIYGMRMIAEDQSLMGGQGELFSKFGLEISDDINLITTRKEFVERLTGEEIIIDGEHKENIDDSRDHSLSTTKPHIKDLVWVPMWNSMFEITFVEDDEGMMNGFRGYWKLICKKYIRNRNDDIDITQTGNDFADNDAEDIGDIIDSINNTIVDEDTKIIDATNLDNINTPIGSDETGYDPDETGFEETYNEPNSDDDIVNDDAERDTTEIRDDSEDGGSDLFSNW